MELSQAVFLGSYNSNEKHLQPPSGSKCFFMYFFMLGMFQSPSPLFSQKIAEERLCGGKLLRFG